MLDRFSGASYKSLMFGFSLQKLLVLAGIIAAVWYGFQWLSRLDKQRKADQKVQGGGGRKARSQPAKGDEPEDMVQCPTCGSFVIAKSSSNCGRSDCPY